jgi:hypothetical protein
VAGAANRKTLVYDRPVYIQKNVTGIREYCMNELFVVSNSFAVC